MKISKLRHATSTRMIRGESVPRQNTTSFGMRAALKKGGSRYAGESGEVEGGAARPRLDRPGRKAGGRVCKADGGEAVEKRVRSPGELDEGAQRDYLKSKAKDAVKNNDMKTAGGVGLVGTGLGTTLAHVGSRFGRPGRIGGLIATGLGLGALSSAGRGEIEKKKLDAEAKEFDKADAGERKFGGRAKMKKKG